MSINIKGACIQYKICDTYTDTNIIVSAGNDNTIKVWNLFKRKPFGSYGLHTDRVECLACINNI